MGKEGRKQRERERGVKNSEKEGCSLKTERERVIEERWVSTLHSPENLDPLLALLHFSHNLNSLTLTENFYLLNLITLT